MTTTIATLLEKSSPCPVPFAARQQSCVAKPPARRLPGRPGRARGPRPTGPDPQTASECVWVTELNGHIVGLIGVVHSAGRVVINRFRIDPKWQHTKVLTELLRYVHEYCVSQGGLRVAIEEGCMPGWIVAHFAALSQARGKTGSG